jgi:hypothetical protein
MNILILYCLHLEFPVRKSIDDHLYSFKRYSNNFCVYINLMYMKIPKSVYRKRWDLIVFSTSFLSIRWDNRAFDKVIKKARGLIGLNSIKIAIPQDEFFNTKRLCEFLDEFDVDHVFSVAPESEWTKIYGNFDFKIHSVLTGYISDEFVNQTKKLSRKITSRKIDVCYRSWHAEYWLGSFGQLKVKIAEQLKNAIVDTHLIADISTDQKDTLFGDDWIKFLLKSKYTIGVEGGASILDYDGSLMRSTRKYLEKNPDARYEEVEANCFPGLDGEINLYAISPRHLEACVTKTCQILIAGHYSGVLQPNEHYLVLSPDFSNLKELLHLISCDCFRHEIVEKAYKDIVLSGAFSYKGFVEKILSTSCPNTITYGSAKNLSKSFYCGMIFMDHVSWLRVAFNVKIIIPIKKIIKKYIYMFAVHLH